LTELTRAHPEEHCKAISGVQISLNITYSSVLQVTLKQRSALLSPVGVSYRRTHSAGEDGRSIHVTEVGRILLLEEIILC